MWGITLVLRRKNGVCGVLATVGGGGNGWADYWGDWRSQSRVSVGNGGGFRL